MKEILLTQGFRTIVDDEDYEELSKHKWYAKYDKRNKKCYAARGVRNGSRVIVIRMHRQIMNCPVGMDVDHIDNNSLNNRRGNLEIVSRQENSWRVISRRIGISKDDIPF